jgi:hypothetical protein
VKLIDERPECPNQQKREFEAGAFACRHPFMLAQKDNQVYYIDIQVVD